jgi:hypothetical protein
MRGKRPPGEICPSELPKRGGREVGPVLITVFLASFRSFLVRDRDKDRCFFHRFPILISQQALSYLIFMNGKLVGQKRIKFNKSLSQ